MVSTVRMQLSAAGPLGFTSVTTTPWNSFCSDSICWRDGDAERTSAQLLPSVDSFCAYGKRYGLLLSVAKDAELRGAAWFDRRDLFRQIARVFVLLIIDRLD